MESLTYDKTVAVAVKKGKYSQLALKWAVENLAKETRAMITLLHVRPKAQAFNRDLKTVSYSYGRLATQCGEEIAKELEQSFRETLNLQVKEMLSPLSSYCKRKKVQCEEVIVEEFDPVRGITDFVLKYNVDVLVIGSGSSGHGGFLRKIIGPEIASKIAKNVPYFCTVYTIGKGGAISVKSSSTSVQTLPPLASGKIKNSEASDDLESVNSQREPLISVNAQKSLLESNRGVEFKFRSPLKNYGDSDFSWNEQSQTDSDISYISSDKDFYERLSSGYSTNSSNFSIGSFDSWQTSSSSSSFAMSPTRTSVSDSSYSSEFSMDEMRKLQLELMQTKKMYEAACQDALDAKMPASKLKSNDLQDDIEMKRSQVSTMALANLENNEDETATRITDVITKLAELEALHISRS